MTAIIKATMEGIICDYDSEAEKMFLWSFDEIVGKKVTIIIPERFRIQHAFGIRQYAKTRVSRGLIGKELQVYGLRKGNVEFPLQVNLTVEGEFFINRMEDISVQRQLQNALRIDESISTCWPYQILLVEPLLSDQQNFVNTVRESRLCNTVVICVSAAEAMDYANKRNRYFGQSAIPYIAIVSQILPDYLGTDLVSELQATGNPPLATRIVTQGLTPDDALRKPISVTGLLAALPAIYLGVWSPTKFDAPGAVR